ncbi:MAG: acetolactate synthase small subunit [Candidatus Latescibacteria bacterium 4484_181]|nr:MAG: acetolactate synthase small subunit [Candidatus Latescibacteria bacterium 4484_181]RKY69047.1 MAG: acetolactate synthase small subunit [Candidatus Latescibacterota bacterium]RKY73830.1 MAG: acetolactate synthase small subunit [Candidatus Latescibacterota bacterium]
MKHTISVMVENHFGVLARVSSLFSGRGFNIDSLTVGETEDPTISRMTIVVEGDDRILEQVTKQLNKLIDVIKVIDMTGENFVERELLLIKVAATPAMRSEIMQIVNIFRAKIVDISFNSLTVEATGGKAKIDAIIGMLRPFGIKEIARTGRVAMLREFRGKV